MQRPLRPAELTLVQDAVNGSFELKAINCRKAERAYRDVGNTFTEGSFRMTKLETGVPGAYVGHGHLMVADLDRSIAFYRDIVGMRVVLLYGEQAAFLSFDDYHHHLGLNTWESKDGTPPPKGHTGLYHVAFVFPDRKTLGQAIDRVQKAGYKLTGAADHGVSEAVYLDDPDGNGLELYRDRPRVEWKFGQDGSPMMINGPLDVAGLVDEGRA
jgi:catechol 2,3-dioxygenase